jgi:hypothetical protein
MKIVELKNSFEEIENLASLITNILKKDNKKLDISEDTMLMAIAEASGYNSISELYNKDSKRKPSLKIDSELSLEYLLALGTIDQIMHKLSIIKKSLKLKKTSDKQAFEMIEMTIFISYKCCKFNGYDYLNIEAIEEQLKPQNIQSNISINYRKYYKDNVIYEKLNKLYLTLPGKPKIKEHSSHSFYYYDDEDKLNGHAHNKIARISENALILLDRIKINCADNESIDTLDYLFFSWFQRVSYAMCHSKNLALNAALWTIHKNEENQKDLSVYLYKLLTEVFNHNKGIFNQINTLLPKEIKLSEDDFIMENTTYFMSKLMNVSPLDFMECFIPKTKEEFNQLKNHRKTDYDYQSKEHLLRSFYLPEELEHIVNEEDEFKKNYPKFKYINAIDSTISIINTSITEFWRHSNLKYINFE